MPDYEFECKDCGKTSTITASIREKERGLVCPHCGSVNIEQVFTGFNVLGRKTESSCDSCPAADDSFFPG